MDGGRRACNPTLAPCAEGWILYRSRPMKVLLVPVSLFAFCLAATAQNYVSVWQLGISNNSQTEFAQEDGNVNSAPGSATAKDDDYYFAGDYPEPIGSLAQDEPLANMERANLVVDTTNRIHFNLDSSVSDATDFRLTIDVCCSNHNEFRNSSGPIPFDVYVNDVFQESFSTNGQNNGHEEFTVEFTAAEVAALTGPGGDNVVSIERQAGQGGGWMQFDTIHLEVDADTLSCSEAICAFEGSSARVVAGESVTLSWIVSPGASGLSIDNGVGEVEALTVDGVGEITVEPIGNTTYTLTSTLGGEVTTATVGVDVAVIESFTVTAEEVLPGESVSLDWVVDPSASVTIDQGIGNLDTETIEGIGTVEIVPTGLATTYTLTATRGPDVETATLLVRTNPFTPVWTLGVNDGTQQEFSQERGGATAAPGSASALDDDFYFAGFYPAPIGIVASDEPDASFERALVLPDPEVRIHFNLPASEVQPGNQLRLRIDLCCTNHQGGGPINFEALFNGVQVLTASTSGVNSREEIHFSDVFTVASVSAVAGENIVTLRREAGQGAGWMQFDQIQLESAPGLESRLALDVEHSPDVPGALRLTWPSDSTKQYDVLVSADLTSPIETWAELAGAQNIAADPSGTNTLDIDRPFQGLGFLAIRAKDPPPLFSEDFEDGPGDWTTVVNDPAGKTEWQFGTPNGSGPTSGADGSANAWSTNLGDYGPDSDISLRSPAIDLAAVGEAVLSFDAYRDGDGFGETATVRFLRASDQVVLGAEAPIDMTVFDGDYEKVEIPVPVEAIGESILIEINFVSDTSPDAYSGLTIDNVSVSAN